MKEWFDGVMMHQYVIFYPLIGCAIFMIILTAVLWTNDSRQNRIHARNMARIKELNSRSYISKRNTARIAQARQQRLTERAERFRALRKEK